MIDPKDRWEDVPFVVDGKLTVPDEEPEDVDVPEDDEENVE